MLMQESSATNQCGLSKLITKEFASILIQERFGILLSELTEKVVKRSNRWRNSVQSNALRSILASRKTGWNKQDVCFD